MVYAIRAGLVNVPVNRRSFLRSMAGLASLSQFPLLRALGALGGASASPGFRFVDVTSSAGIQFRHNSGAFGGKFLPETLGSGCAFLDYDRDGWQDILLINGMDWPGHKQRRSTLRLYRNNRNGTFTDVTSRAGLDIEMYGMGVAVGDYDNDGFPDILVTCVGQNRLFHNTGKGTFTDVTNASGLGKRLAFSTSALWFDYDRDGLLDLFVCNYVKWSPEHDVFCSLDGKNKSYCTPEAYRGETCWLFHNRGKGTFEDVTASSGIFDSSSKSLGVAMLDDDHDGWPDLLVANDTQPNKLYRNQRNGTFKDAAVEAGLAFSSEGKARAGMGVDIADFRNSGYSGVAITNFDNEMTGLYEFGGKILRRRRSASRNWSCFKKQSGFWMRLFSTPILTAGSILPWPTATSTKPCATFAAMWDMPSPRSCSSTMVGEDFAMSHRNSTVDSSNRKWGADLLMPTSIAMATLTC